MNNELRFHHIGIACRDIDATKAFYEAQGYTASEIIDDLLQDVHICFLNNSEMPLIELLAPIGNKSPINRTLEVSGVTPYHICYEVDDIIEASKELKSQHFVQVSKPTPACAIDNKRVCFLYSKNNGLIELVER